MTRDKLWEIVTTKLVWVDYWNGESEPSEEIKEILTNSLLIPKPKFKKGDRVKNNYSIFTIDVYFYDYGEKIWKYDYGKHVMEVCAESELELVEVER